METCFDEAFVDSWDQQSDVVVTTSHEDESLEEALWFVTKAAYPADAYEAAWQTVVVAVVDNDGWFRRSDEYLAAGAPTLDEA